MIPISALAVPACLEAPGIHFHARRGVPEVIKAYIAKRQIVFVLEGFKNFKIIKKNTPMPFQAETVGQVGNGFPGPLDFKELSERQGVDTKKGVPQYKGLAPFFVALGPMKADALQDGIHGIKIADFNFQLLVYFKVGVGLGWWTFEGQGCFGIGPQPQQHFPLDKARTGVLVADVGFKNTGRRRGTELKDRGADGFDRCQKKFDLDFERLHIIHYIKTLKGYPSEAS
jgi:hypothetical protein